MANQKDKLGIFLTVIIVLLIVATGVYAFIYREKIAETIQKFTKKENKEVYEIRTTKKSQDSTDEFSLKEKKSKQEDILLDDPKIENPKTPSPPLFEPSDSTKPNLKERDSKTKSNTPRLSEPEDKFLDPADSPYKKTARLDRTEEDLHSEFVGKPVSSKHKKNRTKVRKRARISHKNTPLERRVRELEEKFGVRAKRKSNLEKRISRLEKLEKRVSRLEKLASKKAKEE